MARFTQSGSGDGSGAPGPTGPQGPAGADGADGTNGLDGQGFNFRGEWVTDTLYLENDVVTQNGSTYIANYDYQDTSGPYLDGDLWAPLALKGADGTNGSDGLDGSNGADGIDGADALWNYTGEYNGGASYAVGDIATYDGQLWYRYNSNGGNVGDTPSPGLWNLLAAKGADGADGVDGTNGANGNDGSPGLVYLGNYVSGNGYLANVAVVKGSDNNLYIATSSGGLGDPVGNTAEWSIFLPKGADGSNGADGTNGADGADGSDGADGISFIWSATWDPGTTYPLNYVVSYEGSSYIKIANETVGDFPLPTNNTYWNLVAQKGDTGAQGEPGVSGTTAVLEHSVKAGEALTKGQAVYVSSADGTNMIVSKASNAMESTSSKTMGLITTDLANNGQGTIITEGLLAGLNTNGANAGDPVWLGTDGNLIYGLLNKPSAPAHLVFIGVVTRANANNGEIFVKPQNGFEVKELHDAVIDSNGSIADNEVFAYDSTSGMWKNQTAAEAGLQTRVLNVSDAEIGYLANVTSDIQTQINEKAALLSPTITMANFASANSGIDPVTISTANAHGGAGFAGLMTFENSTSGATNKKKFLRMDSSGALEIINNAYSDTIFYLADNGNLSELGTVNGATIGDSGWQTVSTFANSFTGTNVSYRKINNVVYLRGRVSGGTAGTGAFILPSEYRSVVEGVYVAQQYGTANMTYVTIGADGVVLPNTSSAWLSGISYPVA